VRVPAEKIDHLLDLVGEVMQDRRRLAHALGSAEGLPTDAADELSAGERMLDELKDSAVGMRTLPVSMITGPLPRAVRDLARTIGREVDFTVVGAETELDRVILESLSEPLTHLLRNAVIHGIEPPAEREQAGKPARGRIELRAVPRGGLVEITVSDDGRGVSPEIIDEARQEGSLADVLSRAGFSTAGEVTDLAGRGVGLDAVKTHVHSLGGRFEVSSEPGHGMVVSLLLPVALALLKVLLIERGGAVYGLPIAGVEEVVTVDATTTLQGRVSLNLRGRPMPVADLAAVIGADAPPLPPRPPALILTAEGRWLAAACDSLLGEEEVVVKPLGPLLAGVSGYLGAAILGDGRIALLVEPGALIRGHRRATRSGLPASLAPDSAATASHTPGHSRPAPGSRAAGPGTTMAPEGSAPDSAAAGWPAPGPVPAGTAGPAKILVVEDSFIVRELQRCVLESAGHHVITARDGREALDCLGRDAEIELVVTDLEMPTLGGLELTREIRADERRSSLPVVMVTSRGSEEDRRRGMEAGVDAYIAKQGFQQSALLATINQLLGR
jgi:two-component system chemotaxis sensor kinase CheA